MDEVHATLFFLLNKKYTGIPSNMISIPIPALKGFMINRFTQINPARKIYKAGMIG
jgi:hypothetical protein